MECTIRHEIIEQIVRLDLESSVTYLIHFWSLFCLFLLWTAEVFKHRTAKFGLNFGLGITSHANYNYPNRLSNRYYW